ncbi:MAG: glycosyltransferase family 4 protein [Acidimicrobiia bacterium]|nr:glycosyltransferase family 4 protein [Acidimicrobiia bacterium]
MRIAIDVTPLAHPNSGIGHFVSLLVPTMESRGFDVTQFAVSGSATAGRSHFPGAELVRVPSATAAFRFWGSFAGRVPDALKHVDLVHGSNYVTPPPGGSPCVCSVHDASPWLADRWGERPNKTVTRLIERRVKHGAWVHTLTNATAAVLSDLLETDRVRVAPIPPARVADASRDDLPVRLAGRPYILCLGAEKRRKQLDAVVAGFRELAHIEPDIALVIAGAEGDASASLTESISRLGGLSERVYRLGQVDTSKRNALVTFARAVCYLSHHEGQGLPVLEAQSLGVPVVIGQDAAVAETAGDGAVPCDPSDVESVASALQTAVEDDSRREQLRSAGLANASRFTVERFGDDMDEIYRQAAGQ